MSEAVRFLHALAHAVAAITLYSPGHPSIRRSAEHLWQALNALLKADEHPLFFFLGTAPVYQGRAIHELRDWPYSRRITEAGIHRLEFDENITPGAVAAFLDRLRIRLATGQPAPGEGDVVLPGILYGTVAVQEIVADEGFVPSSDISSGTVELHLDLTDELQAMAFIRQEAERGVVAKAETDAIVRILGGLLDEYPLPQATPPEDHTQYHTVHPVNTALLAMAASTASGVDAGGRHRIGMISLLHDLGMARLPRELGELPMLTEEARARVETHPYLGAKLLLEMGGGGFELAAVVAFEHHLRPDGTGYPARRFRPVVHWASRLIGVCSAFTALRSPRPFRLPWAAESAARYLEEGAGTVFDAEAAKLLASVVRPTT